MERAVIMSQGSVLEAEQFFFSGSSQQKQQDRNSEELNLENYDLEKVEKILIRKVLQKHNGNISKAANELGLTRSSLYRRLEKYEL